MATEHPILQAAFHGETKTVLAALDGGLSVNITDVSGNSLLLMALRSQNFELARELMRRGFDPRLVYKLGGYGDLIEAGQLPLGIAVQVGADDVVDQLLAKGIRAYPKFYGDPYIGEKPPVEAAIANDRPVVLRKLLASVEPEILRAKMRTPDPAYNFYSYHCLEACRSVATLDILVDYGADINAVSDMQPFGTLLHAYAARGWQAGVERALALGVDPTKEAENHAAPETVAKTEEIKRLLRVAALKRHVERGQLTNSSEGPAPAGKTNYAAKVFATEVLVAAITDSEEAALKLLHDYVIADLNARDDRNWSLLNYALYYHFSKLAAALIEGGVEVDNISERGFSVMAFAVNAGDLELVRKLAARKADLNAAGGKGSPPLLIAVQAKNFAMVNLLLQLGAKTEPLPLRRSDDIWQNALMIAAKAGSIELLDRLYDAGGDMAAVDTSGESVVFYAVRSGKPEVLQWTIDHKAYLQLKTSRGTNALTLAASLGKLEIVKMLIALGLTHPDALRYAELSGSGETAAYLRSLAAPSAANDATSLWQRHDRISLEEVRKYIAGGGDVNYAVDCPTPLQVMAGLGDVEAVELLLSTGADPYKRGHLANSAVFMAIGAAPTDEDALRMLRAFLDHGISPNTQEFGYGYDPPEKIASGWSLLTTCLWLGRVTCAEFLLEKGANPALRDTSDGKDSFDMLKTSTRLSEDQRFALRGKMEANRPVSTPVTAKSSTQ